MKDKKNKTPFIETKTRPNNSVEIEIKKSPAQTVSGKIFLVLIIAGTVLLPLGVMIYLLIQAVSK